MDIALRAKIQNTKRAGDLFEHIIIALYTRLLSSNAVAVDGGANVGWHTFQMAEHLSSGTVHAFEALPTLFDILRQRAARFGERVVARQVAISDFVGEADFNYYNLADPNHPNHPHWNAGLSGLKSDAQLLAKEHLRIRVPVTTFDAYFSDFPVVRLDSIKLDIEGAEYSAMKGGRNVIQALRPLIAFEDGGPRVGMTYGYSADALPTLIDELDYELFDILGEPYAGGRWVNREIWRPWYSLAIPKEYARLASLKQGIADAVRAFTL